MSLHVVSWHFTACGGLSDIIFLSTSIWLLVCFPVSAASVSAGSRSTPELFRLCLYWWRRNLISLCCLPRCTSAETTASQNINVQKSSEDCKMSRPASSSHRSHKALNTNWIYLLMNLITTSSKHRFPPLAPSVSHCVSVSLHKYIKL